VGDIRVRNEVTWETYVLGMRSRGRIRVGMRSRGRHKCRNKVTWETYV
jgi:hypothetical protein